MDAGEYTSTQGRIAMIRTVIVDDEPHVLNDLAGKIEHDKDFEIVAKCGNAFEAIREINRHSPDVVFLDIRMPKISGIEMLSMLDRDAMPRIVFVTAHGEFAIEAFRENAIDFLLKPVDQERLDITLERLKQDHQAQPQVEKSLATDLKFIPCYRGSNYYLINLKEVVHLFSTPTTGVHLVTADAEHEFHTNLGLKVLADNGTLLRCHRQHMVNPDFIKWIERLENGLGQIHLSGGHVVPVSRGYMTNFPALA